MLSEPWRDLSQETRAALLEAHASVCGAEPAGRLATALRAGRDLPRSPTSRQAQYARMRRMLVTSMAACAVHAIEKPRFAELFQRTDFAALRPNCADAHRRFAEIVRSRGLRNPELERTWASQAAAFMSLAPRARTLGRDELLVLHATLVPLFACAITGSRALLPAWQVLWRQASRQGVIDNPGLRAHLAGLASFTGESAFSFEVQRDPRLCAIDFAAILCLVRRDDSDDLRDRTAAIMRGDDVAPTDCLYPLRPASTIARITEYIGGLMRNPYHFSNEGLMISVLSWTSQVARVIDTRRDEWSGELSGLLRGLARIEQVQLLEKTRFFRVLEAVPPGPAREHLLGLWTRSNAAAQRA